MIQISWTTPRTWAVAETLTAANMNTHVRDNLNWLANDRPRCSALRATTQSIANTTATKISYTSADEFDVGPMHDPASNASRVTVPSGGGGLYLIVANVTWAAAAAGNSDVLLYKNGVLIAGTGDTRVLDTAGNTIIPISVLVPLVATDYVECEVLQSSGVALDITHSRLQAIWQAF